jgi:ribose-phosphate pyrophosphokinase
MTDAKVDLKQVDADEARMIGKIAGICQELDLLKELHIPKERLAEVIRTKFSDFRLVAGRSNEPLAKDIADRLGITLMSRTLKDFGNTEIKCKIDENVREKDIYILQSGGWNKDHSINDFLVELCLMVSACRRSSANLINVIAPCYFYARADKKDDGRTAIGAAEVATMLEAMGVNRITAVDLHAGQIQGMYKGPFDNIYAKKWVINYLLQHDLKGLTRDELMHFVWISPDFGGEKRVLAYATKLGMRHAVISKQRNYAEISSIEKSVLHCDFDLKGCTGILVDDMGDTFGTMVSAVKELGKYGMARVIIVIIHAVLSGEAIKRINECENIVSVIATDTLDQTDNLKICPKLRVIPLGEMFAEVLVCQRMGASVSHLLA